MLQRVYTSKTPFVDKGSTVLVITCSSNAFAPYTDEFLASQGLPVGAYDQLAVPGGPHFLLLSEYLPKFAWAGQRWIKFLIEKHELKRIILITHEDCAWYADDRHIPALLHRLGVSGESLKQRQQRDLEEIVAAVRQQLPAVAVEAYYASKDPTDNLIHFSKLI